MKYLNLRENFNSNIIEKIKNELINYYDYDNYDEFVNNQEMGDCQSIVYFIDKMNLPGVSRHFGEIEIDEPHYNIEDDEEINKFTHHWVTLNGEILEFSKGTLKDYINWEDPYCPENTEDWRYNSIGIIKESKNYQRLYHILGFEKIKYLFDKDQLVSYRAGSGDISFTRNKMRNSYVGSDITSFFKLEVDGEKLSQNYKINPFRFKSFTNVYLDEEEEVLELNYKPLKPASKYITKLIIIKSALERLKSNYFSRDEGEPTDWYTTAGTRVGTIPEIIKWVKENSPYELYVQDGSVIKKDDEYIDSIINYELKKVIFKYDVWYRGYFKIDSDLLGKKDVIIDSEGNKHVDWVVGGIYSIPYELKDKEDIDLNVSEKIIDGEKCKPYIIKFRKTKKGWYLEEVEPLKWLNPDQFFESSINEWISNEKSTKFLLNKMLRKIQNKSKNKIKKNQFTEERTRRGYKFNFLWVEDHTIFEKILKEYQKIFLKNGILLSYKKHNLMEHDLGDNLDIVSSKPSDKKEFILYVKDLYSKRVKPPRYLYHVSDKENRKSIEKNGLVPKDWNKGNWKESMDYYYPPAIFVSDNIKGWPHQYGKDIWRIDTKNLKNKWWEDLNFHKVQIIGKKEGELFMTFDKIPTENIKLL